MKWIATWGVFLILVAFVFAGCCTWKTRTNVKTRWLPTETTTKLSITQPVAILNVSPAVPRANDCLCGFAGTEITGSLYDFTDAAVGAAKEVMERNNIKINDKADKMLELSIVKVNCSWVFLYGFSWGVTLKVKTGDGLEKEYPCMQTTGTMYPMTRAFELTIGKCVEQMLKDKDIAAYLEK